MDKGKGIRIVALIAIVIVVLIGAAIIIKVTLGSKDNQNHVSNLPTNETVESKKMASIYDITGVDDEKIHVGDYVDYEPEVKTITVEGKYTGIENDIVMQTEDLKWRVLDMKNGCITLISDKPTESTLELVRSTGYCNSVKLLNDICSTLYTNSNYAKEVRSLARSDVYKKMAVATQNIVHSGNYGIVVAPETIGYPAIAETNATNTNYKESDIYGTEAEEERQSHYITSALTEGMESVKYTFWERTAKTSDFTKSTYYSLFISNSNVNYNEYYLATRCAEIYMNDAYFNLSYIGNGKISAYRMYCSNGDSYNTEAAIRPVVTLNAETQTIGKDANGVWILK